MTRPEPMIVFLLSPNQIEDDDWGHQLFKNEIGQQTNVIYYGPGFPKYDPHAYDIREIMTRRFPQKPDVIIIYGWEKAKRYKGFDKIVDIPKVYVGIDYDPCKDVSDQDEFLRHNDIDIIFAPSVSACRSLVKKHPDKAVYHLPFSVDYQVYRPMGLKREDHVLIVPAPYCDFPDPIWLQDVADKSGYPIITQRKVRHGCVQAINESKISIAVGGCPHILEMTCMEILACCGFLMIDNPDILTGLGFRNKIHFVAYDGIEDLVDKIQYYMVNDDERMKIAMHGMVLVRQKYTCQHMVGHMLRVIRSEFNIR